MKKHDCVLHRAGYLEARWNELPLDDRDEVDLLGGMAELDEKCRTCGIETKGATIKQRFDDAQEISREF